MNFPLVGNEKVKNAVLSFFALDKLPHAILISGENGTGKHTLARFMATAAVCTGNIKPCGECHGCKMSAANSHPDIITVTKESGKKELSVGIIRETRADAFIKPHESLRKIYIIENADSMNISAQNALLKVLEEPPENVVFILICSSKASLLPTLLSRCTPLSLFPPPEKDGVEILEKLSGCDLDLAEKTLKKTCGNIGLALKLIDKSAKNTAAESAEEFIELIFSSDDYGMLKLLGKFEKDRALADEFFSELKIKIASELKHLPKNGRRAKVLFDLYSNTDRYSEHLKSNVNLPLLFCGIVADINEYMR